MDSIAARGYAGRTTQRSTERQVAIPVRSLSHVGIAVPDLEAAIALYRERYGLPVSEPHEAPAQKVRIAYVDLGNARLELISPSSPDSPLVRFLARHPQGGLHHLALGTADAQAAAEAARGDGVGILGSGAPAPGHHGRPLFFLDPKALAGVLTEIEEEPHGADGGTGHG